VGRDLVRVAGSRVAFEDSGRSETTLGFFELLVLHLVRSIFPFVHLFFCEWKIVSHQTTHLSCGPLQRDQRLLAVLGFLRNQPPEFGLLRASSSPRSSFVFPSQRPPRQSPRSFENFSPAPSSHRSLMNFSVLESPALEAVAPHPFEGVFLVWALFLSFLSNSFTS